MKVLKEKELRKVYDFDLIEHIIPEIKENSLKDFYTRIFINHKLLLKRVSNNGFVDFLGNQYRLIERNRVNPVIYDAPTMNFQDEPLLYKVKDAGHLSEDILITNQVYVLTEEFPKCLEIAK